MFWLAFIYHAKLASYHAILEITCGTLGKSRCSLIRQVFQSLPGQCCRADARSQHPFEAAGVFLVLSDCGWRTRYVFQRSVRRPRWGPDCRFEGRLPFHNAELRTLRDGAPYCCPDPEGGGSTLQGNCRFRYGKLANGRSRASGWAKGDHPLG